MDEEIKTKDQFRISFSQYSTYLQCPHKWYLNYLLKMPSDHSEELVFGSSVHAVIEELLTNSTLRRLYKVDKEKVIRDIFKSAVKDELSKIDDITFLNKFRSGELVKIFMAQAEKLIVQLDFFNRFKNWEVADVEFKLDGLKIAEDENTEIVYKGFIDLVLKSKVEEDTYMILDWKTSGKQWDIVKKLKDNRDFFAQLCLYKKFYSDVKGIPIDNIETKFYNLPRMEPSKQNFYVGNLRQEYIDNFIKKFTDTCFKMVEHKKSMTDFTKVKIVTKQNFCFRCVYNTPELCNDTEEFQLVTLPEDLSSK